MDLLDPFSCQLHHIAFDKLKSHTPLPCPGTQSINIPLKFYSVFFILNFTIANKVISKKSYFRLNICRDVIYVQREQQGKKISKKSYFRLNICRDVIYVQREQQGTKNSYLTKPGPSQILFHLQQLVVV